MKRTIIGIAMVLILSGIANGAEASSLMKFDFTTAYDFGNGRTEGGFDVPANAQANISGYFTVRDANGDGIIATHELEDYYFEASNFHAVFGIGEYTGNGSDQLGCDYYTLGCIGPDILNHVSTDRDYFVTNYHVGPLMPYPATIPLSDGLIMAGLSFIDGETGYMLSFAEWNLEIWSVFDVDESGSYKHLDYSDAGNIGFLTSIQDGYTVVEPSPVPIPASLPLLAAGLAGLCFIPRRKRLLPENLSRPSNKGAFLGAARTTFTAPAG